jgi:hypothetical protein
VDEYEDAMIKMIRDHHAPERALQTAVQVITDFLRQLRSSEAPADDALEEPA